MTLPRTDTRVTYATGALEERSTVLHVEPVGDRIAVLTESTSVHPVDASWPDQGADVAEIVIGGRTATIVDCVVGATDGRSLFLGSDIPARPGDDGWTFVVAHLVDADSGLNPAEGDEALLRADADTRGTLSIGHTACHLASLALNRAVADRWTKETRLDALGSPDFDAAAISSSTIEPFGSVDVFRLNKSLRRKGFTTEGLTGDLPDLARAIDAQLSEWIDTAASVTVERDGELLTDLRHWVCDLPGGAARIACGGTHVTSLAELGRVTVDLASTTVDGTDILTMTTRAVR
ncbi:metal-dependent hydrolase [Agromyces atrinae]|uniref:Alanyl-tRNA synthetase n=1 Tax=Agromyces atrinae TaxID=592376 RepID=A0A4Q2M2S4_9MICO|nr:metal-dependent hydrolase [Agromyces atrinae]NYD68742.1 alanyl-tRNA synthetase [Agromyces atrinae]RXZ86099.1 metal-dependent hydrolase [Agromyces atrinae]